MKTLSFIRIMLVLVVVGLVGCTAPSFASSADTGPLRQVIQKGHSGSVNSVAFSPNGSFVLSGGVDYTIILWEVATGRLLRTFIGHSDIVTSVTFSPDGRQALSGSVDSTMRLWEVATGRELRTFTCVGSVKSVAFSPDGHFALCGGGYFYIDNTDNTLKLFDIFTGTELHTFTGHSAIIYSVAFSPNGRYALSGSMDKTMKLWDVTNGAELRTFVGHSDVINSVAFSLDGSYALSGSEDKTLKLWDVTTGTELHTFIVDSLNSVVFSPDSKFAIVSGESHEGNCELKLWKIATGKEHHTFAKYCHPIAFSPDSRLVISGESGDDRLKMWDVLTGTELRTFESSAALSTVAFSPNDRLALSGVAGNLELWDIVTGTELRTFSGHSNRINSVAFSPNVRFAISGGEDNILRLWDVATGTELRTFIGHSQSINSVVFSPDGRLVLSGGGRDIYNTDSQTITFYDTQTNEVHNTEILNIYHDRTIRLWEVATGKNLRTFTECSGGVNSVAFSPDGQFALSGNGEIGNTKAHDLVKLWKISTGKKIKIFAGKFSIAYAVTFSPDGQLVLVGGLDGVKLLNAATGKELITFTGHSLFPGELDHAVLAVTFSPDSRFVLSGSANHTMKLWKVASGKELQNFVGHTGMIMSVALSQDGTRAFSGSDDGTIRVWNVNSGQEIARMISTTDGEWLVATPDGYYNTSPEGKSAVHYASATETYGFEQFESLFRRPDIIQARLAGNLKAGTPAPKLTRPPRVTLVSIRNLTPTTDQAIYPLAITATSHDDVVQTVRVFVNGKPALEKPVNAKEQRLDFEVPLFAGPNRITTVAYDRKGFSSNQASIDIISTVPGAKKPTLFVMAVGISEYPKIPKSMQLDYAHTDAQNLVKTLRQQKGQLFADVRDFTLINQEATPRAITDGLHALSAMDANDIAIIFFAGHGVHSKDGRFWYVTQQGSLKQPESGGLDWQTLNEYFNHIKGRVILFLDACHSGSITDETIVPNDQLAAKFFKGGMGGVMVFSASKGRQQSLEGKNVGGGLFTHYLTQGLTAKETDRDNNGFVEFMELVDYVSKTVNDETAGQQTPWLSRRELFGDLAVATVQQ